MRSQTMFILVLIIFFYLIMSLNSLGYISVYHMVNLPPGYYECIYENVNNGLYVVYYSTAPIYFVIQTLGGYTVFSFQGSSYYGYVNLSSGEYKLLFVNNMTNTNVTIQTYIGNGRPSPTGIADYGIESVKGVVSPYIEKFNEVVGVAQIYYISAYNNSLNSYGASLQLNTVLQVNTKYGSQQYWLQNVIEFITNTSQYYYEDNVWNFTSSTSVLNTTSVIGEGSIYSTFVGITLNDYYAYDTQFYKLTYPLYTALIIRVNSTPQGVNILFGYLNETSFNYYDNVTIKVQGITSAYLLVDGYNNTGSGNAYDTEFVFGGQYGGEITKFNQINALIYMFYLNNNTIIIPKSLLPFGIDTAEASDNLVTIPYQGAYQVKVGEGEELLIPNTSSPFKAKIINGSKVIDIGQRGEIELNVTGGEPPYIVEIGNKTFVDLFIGNTYYPITPNKVGNLTCSIIIRDLYGSILELNHSLEVNPDPSVNITILRNVTDVRLPVVFTIHPKGGTPPYTETWFINGTAVSSKTAFNYTFTSAGVYNITVKLTDFVNYTVEDSAMLIVYKDPTLVVTTNATESDEGIPIALNVNSSYGVPPYMIKVYVNGTIVNSSIIKSETELPLNLPYGTYLVNITLTDSVGYQLSNDVILRFNQDPILTINWTSQNNFLVKTTSINLSGEGSRGIPPYTYTVYVNGKEYYTGNNLSLNIPLKLGENNVTIIMKDSLGITATRTIIVYSNYNWVNIIIISLIILLFIISLLLLLRRK
ncbi:hypothetical protein EWF20_04710 [Sulfolobus sp. S-194]|uniref:thermopsin family protease n=1 Tax=Sulfolobus sp. S-194 TaxID=2512240 RepID=UPI001436F9FF|nr:thermopsin family protease [Sulfolobus sp. S-194]QIW23525.1 hypothetical protein EWF20_04710 [Sulfolobus sp. S-194]